MIATTEERDALMDAIELYGDSRAYVADDAAERLAAIRAMLAPPDNAVLIPRALAERAAENLEISANEFRLVDMMDAANERQADADALRAVLRGEATRDNAVLIPRALAERLQDASEIVAFIAHGNDDQVTNKSRMADADALRAVLRGEATRDE